MSNVIQGKWSSSGSGGGEGPDIRLTRLETHFEYVQKDLGEIRSDLKYLRELPSRSELNAWKWQWVAVAIAIIALTVGGITGGLALINRSVDIAQTAAPAPAPPPPAPKTP